MIDLIVAMALMQTGDPCQAVPQGDTTRSCPPWRSLHRDERLELLENPASVARHGGTFEISLRTILAADLPHGTRSAVIRHRFDCARRTSVQLHITTYNAGGALMEDRDATAEEAAPGSAPPGSPNLALLTEYCPR